MATTHTIPPTPFPRLGEIYRNLALSLGTKRDSNELDRLAREGEYDWRIPDALMDKLFIEPINELTQRTEQKSKKTLANRFSALTLEYLTYAQQEYLQLFTSMELTATDRKSALPLLIEAFFGPAAGFGLKKFKEELGGPELDKLLDASTNPIEEAFLWFEKTAKINIKELFPESHGSDRYQMELIRRWRAGESVPDYDSIDKTVNEIFNRAQGQDNKQLEELCNKFAFWLLIGRSIYWIEKNQETPIKKIVKNYLVNPRSAQEAAIRLGELCLNKAQKTLNKSAVLFLELMDELYENTTKNKEELTIKIDEFEESLKEHTPQGNFQFYATRFRARWHALNGEMSSALPLYEKALKEASYRGGEKQKNIIQETLVVASYLCKLKEPSPAHEKRINPKSVIKRIKHQAVAVGLIPTPIAGDIVEDWEIEQFLQGFSAVFPKNMFFKNHLPLENPPSHYPFLLIKDGKKITPDLSKPNKIITIQHKDGQTRTMPQINHFVLYNETEAVRELLKHGALPDKLDKQGGSCLLFAIERAIQSNQKETLELLLEYKHKKDTINAVTPIRKLNTLHLALELCDPRVVCRLLEMGGNPMTRAQIENITVLYRWAALLTWVIDPQRPLRTIESEDPVRKRLYNETRRRWARPYADPFGNTPFIDEIKQRNPELAELAKNGAISSTTRNLSLPKLLEIGELLLKAGANPNEQEFFPGIPKVSNPGRTPLMLLAEGGNAEAFDLLVRHGGDPEKRDAMGRNCLQLAIGFGNKAVVDYLTGKQAV